MRRVLMGATSSGPTGTTSGDPGELHRAAAQVSGVSTQLPSLPGQTGTLSGLIVGTGALQQALDNFGQAWDGWFPRCSTNLSNLAQYADASAAAFEKADGRSAPTANKPGGSGK